jgi:hypothetical protein
VPDGIVDAEAHRLTDVGLGQSETDGGEHLDLRPAPERLRVDEQTVEIEDDRIDGAVTERVG